MSDEVIGSFAIQEIHWLKPNITYVLFFTTDKLVALRFRSLENALSTVKEFGKVAVGNERVLVHKILNLVRTKENISGLAKAGEKLNIDCQTALVADKRNFQINYSDISKVEMKESVLGISTARAGYIVILAQGKKKQYDIIAGQKFEDCANVASSIMKNKLQL